MTASHRRTALAIRPIALAAALASLTAASTWAQQAPAAQSTELSLIHI